MSDYQNGRRAKVGDVVLNQFRHKCRVEFITNTGELQLNPFGPAGVFAKAADCLHIDDLRFATQRKST